MRAPWRSRQVRDADYVVLVATAGVAVLGLMTLASIPGADLRRQAMVYVFGVLAFLFAAHVDYRILRHAWQPLYWSTLVLLSLVLVVGKVAGGARQWLAIGTIQVQPSEFAKVVLICCLAVYAAENGHRLKDPIEFAWSFVILPLPLVSLVLLQGDLGTAVVLTAIWAGVVYFAGANTLHIGAFFLAGAVIAKLLWDMGWMPEYRIARILAWLRPRDYLKPPDEMWGMQYLMTQRAIGSGGVWGQGYREGNLTQLRRVFAQETDMTFSALAEEQGFVYCVALIMCYAAIIWRGLRTIAVTQHDLGRYLAAGVISYLGFQVIVNIGMNVGLLPITGIPLPLFSRGGSNLLATMVALGLLVNVHLRRRRITFETAG